jgi:hypothetical protein
LSDEEIRALARAAETEDEPAAWTRLGRALLRASRLSEATLLLVRQRARGVELAEVADALEPASLDGFRIRNLAPREVVGEHPALAWTADGERLFAASEWLLSFDLGAAESGGYPLRSARLRGLVHAIAPDLDGRRVAVVASLAAPVTGSTAHPIEKLVSIADLATGELLGEPIVHARQSGPAQLAWWGDPAFVFVSDGDGVSAYELGPGGALLAPPAWSLPSRTHGLTERGAVVSWRPPGEIVEPFGARDPAPLGIRSGTHFVRCGTTRAARVHAARCERWRSAGTPLPRLASGSWASPTGRYAAAITERTRLELMDLAGEPRSRVFDLGGQATHTGAWSPSGRRFAVGSAAGVFVVEA